MREIQKWAIEINWDKRIKAVCKPCWELKYCPYGLLVEDFPLKKERDDHSCRIFGHDCPVFYVSEPLTETKELRNISRNIQRPVQFRVMKRDNQICRVCGQSVRDEDIEFDHIIPFSKGGSSEENNIRLLCSNCNKKKSNNFEDEYLVRNSSEHMMKPIDLSILELLLDSMDFYHEFTNNNHKTPDIEDFQEAFYNSDNEFIEIINSVTSDIVRFFQSDVPTEMNKGLFRALKMRWGFKDGSLHYIEEVSEKTKIEVEKIIIEEKYFIQLLGWNIPLSKNNKMKWKNF
ncbi:HNH endonuclease [Paenibacillus dauci]|uniref:HNH endonuclease n=1 Tax=Paenibacillus dauci TaxID=1567106 RepID=UPI0006965355|nr:HNH endonuclease signature motif containing protein [Paenibacillus dauci]